MTNFTLIPALSSPHSLLPPTHPCYGSGLVMAGTAPGGSCRSHGRTDGPSRAAQPQTVGRKLRIVLVCSFLSGINS